VDASAARGGHHELAVLDGALRSLPAQHAPFRTNTVQLGWAASVSGGLTGWRRANHLAMDGGRRCDCCGGRRDDSDRLVDIEGRQRRVGFTPQRKAAHLAFDAALITSVAA
jgi:hypothetical protein